ncbi:MAG: hypothetical protein IT580_10440, partial [Verrucomicrobiales bacterium]|nr:hypothetical protein [Verrucomicrobiales bacterium]
ARLTPYRFDQPPHVVANGTLFPKTPGSADLTFEIEGGPFHFWKLSTPRIRSQLRWQGNHLLLTNLQAEFYRGTLEGHVAFDLTQPDDGRYRFLAVARDASLGDMLHEVTPAREKVAEGTFDLDLEVTSAQVSDLKSWNGSGRASLRDGMLWDAPIFGFLSPALNAIVPGLGNNRAKRADTTFTLTNSVIHTRDLTIACPPAKLFYRGTIDFDQNVDAKVEAQVLSDVLGVGPLFGLLLRPLTKLMEFRVTGTLADVKAEPLYIPKLLLLPLQPVRMFFNLFNLGGGESKSNRLEGFDSSPAVTNAPPLPP